MTDLNLEHDVLVTFAMIPEEEYDQYKSALPYYRNIETQGVKISA